MDLLLLSSPPWHLVKTPLPLSCCWYVPLWARVSLPLLKMKVWRTWKKAETMCWKELRHECAVFFPKVRKWHEERFFFPPTYYLFYPLFLCCFCKRLHFKYFSAVFLWEYLHLLLNFYEFKFLSEEDLESAADRQHNSRFFVRAAEIFSVMLQFALQKLNHLKRWEAQNLWQKNKYSLHFNNGAFLMFYLDYALKISLIKCIMIVRTGWFPYFRQSKRKVCHKKSLFVFGVKTRTLIKVLQWEWRREQKNVCTSLLYKVINTIWLEIN